MEKPKPPVEGIIYGEVAAWVTVVGVIIALVGLIIGITSGNDIVDYSKLVNDLLSGKSEYRIWEDDSKLVNPNGYWFFSQLSSGTGIAMTGIAIAIFGGLVGIWGMVISTFRSREILLYKNGLYTLLGFAIALIISLAATGILSLRH
jgi:hypothetical protein